MEPHGAASNHPDLCESFCLALAESICLRAIGRLLADFGCFSTPADGRVPETTSPILWPSRLLFGSRSTKSFTFPIRKAVCRDLSCLRDHDREGEQLPPITC